MLFGTYKNSLAKLCPDRSVPISCVKTSHKPASGQTLFWQFMYPPRGVWPCLVEECVFLCVCDSCRGEAVAEGGTVIAALIHVVDCSGPCPLQGGKGATDELVWFDFFLCSLFLSLFRPGLIGVGCRIYRHCSHFFFKKKADSMLIENMSGGIYTHTWKSCAGLELVGTAITVFVRRIYQAVDVRAARACRAKRHFLCEIWPLFSAETLFWARKLAKRCTNWHRHGRLELHAVNQQQNCFSSLWLCFWLRCFS